MKSIKGKLWYILSAMAIIFVIGQYTTEILCYFSLAIGLPIVMYLFWIAIKNTINDIWKH